MKDTRSAFFAPESPQDEPIIISDGSEEEEEVTKDKDTEATSYDVYLLQSQKEELEQAKAEAEVVIEKVQKRATRTRESEELKRSKESKSLRNFLLQGPILQFPKVIYNLKKRKEREGPNVQTFQTSTVLTVEKEAGGPFTIHRLLHFTPMVKQGANQN
ncbi:hypothetical protein Tco_0410531 [Tanacetum coccineum]